MSTFSTKLTKCKISVNVTKQSRNYLSYQISPVTEWPLQSVPDTNQRVRNMRNNLLRSEHRSSGIALAERLKEK